ncbi:MAG TPA: hypothetical protein VHE13_16630 [Opitutus sp.]|nr:hypothetical protein [Opitutus sp.]
MAFVRRHPTPVLGRFCVACGLLFGLAPVFFGSVPDDLQRLHPEEFTAPLSPQHKFPDSARADDDNDGIYDDFDPHPGAYDAPVTLTGGDYTLTVLGSGRVANIVVAASICDPLATATNTGFQQSSAITNRLFQQFRDSFDTIILVSDQDSLPAQAYYYGISTTVRNDVGGIGLSIYDSGASYGASGKLAQVLHLATKSGLPGGPSLHELLHRWANYLDSVPDSSAHWGFAGVGGQLGGWAPGTLVSLGNGRYSATNGRPGSTGFGTYANGGNGLPYAPLELYVMGLVPITEVPAVDIAVGASFNDDDTFNATAITTVTPDQIVALDGARSPGYTTSPKQFRVLYAVVTKAPLTNARFASYDADVERFSLVGDEGTTLYNFWEATGGRATVDMGNLQAELKTAPANPLAPTVVTLAAHDASDRSVTLTGSVNPHGSVTSALFEYGPTVTYGATAAVTLVAADSSSDESVSLALTGLFPGTTYHFRLSATNAHGTASGYDASFTTTLPVTTVAGGAGVSGSADGPANAARFSSPHAVAVDSARNIYVADFGNNTIRRISRNGTVTTLAGSPGNAGSADGNGSAARFNQPSGLATDSAGNVFVADSNNHAIRKITPDGDVSTLAGLAGSSGSADGTGSAARFNYPCGIATDRNDNLFVVDTRNQTIRKITPDGVVTTIAGSPGQFGYVDAPGSAARFQDATAITVDGTDNIYVAGSPYSETIRKITPDGVVSTFAGDPSHGGSYNDGVGSAAGFNSPYGLAATPDGTVYVADLDSHTIRQVTPAAVVTTVAGGAGQLPGSVDGTGKAARFNYPRGLAVDPDGNVIVADSANQTVRELGLGQARLVVVPPSAASAGLGATASLTVVGADSSEYQWTVDGLPIGSATSSILSLPDAQPADAGLYAALVSDAFRTVASDPAIFGITTSSKVVGSGHELSPANVVHPNGNVFDQVLLTGRAETITADSGQITRTSYIDLDDDIVQVEFTGPGTLSLVLEDSTGPAPPLNYHQPSVSYMKGHAGIVIVGATAATNVSVFTVGRLTAFDPTGGFNFLLPAGPANDPAHNGSSLFTGHGDTTYDGIADIAFIAIASADGRFGGVRTAGASYFAHHGLTGIYAPGVTFIGPVYLGNIAAFDDAVPAIRLGRALGNTWITGGDLAQPNGSAVQVSGLAHLAFKAGTDSAGRLLPAQANHAVLTQHGVDVTSLTVVDPE